ncbi:MAG TPA: 6-pyruvoyl-tetrahydropterin synthase-related protein, partial [Acidimicrobiales bacterium]|nr:6-pyruvoyl-tetrahydropterin synthase-related protein [Acidimicrobiales bacterium]
MTAGAIGGVVVVVLWQLHPSLLLSNTTITGGDTGAHVGLAGFLKSNLLPHGQVTGWDPGAYDGFPLNSLYFPLPDLLAAVAGYVIPFNVAFKLVTVLGSLTLPVAAWLFGRLAGLERPRPAVLAIFTLPFLFDQSFQIYGGNLYSTMAGEYAFSLGLSFALVFLGLCLRGMRTGRHRGWAAAVLGICILSHLLTALFALAGAVVILLLAGPTRRRLWWTVCAVGGGLLLVSWWVVPFALDQAYATNMGWQNVSTYLTVLFPGGDVWAIVLACLGAILAVVVAVTRRQTAPLVLAVLGIVAALVVRFDPQWTLYNVRFLPFYLLCVYLLAGYVVAEALVAAATGMRRLRLVLWRNSLALGDPGAPTVAYTAGNGAGNGARTPPSVAPAPPGMLAPAPGHRTAPGTPVSAPVAPTALAPSRGTATPSAEATATATARPAVEDRPSPPPEAWASVTGEGGAAPTAPRTRRRRPDAPWPRPRFGPWAPGAVAVPVLAMLVALAVVLPPLVPRLDGWAGNLFDHAFAPSSVPSWSQWNYSGYQDTPGAKELYDGVIPTMQG